MGHLTIEHIKIIIWVLGSIGSGIISILIAWWRFSAWVTRLETSHGQVIDQVIAMTNQLTKLTEASITLSVRLNEREKDIMQLEGALELNRKDTIHLIASLQQSVSSLDAIWRTLQSIYPDKVPRRQSDKWNQGS